MQIKNFGENIVYSPEHHYTPKTEEEVCEILRKHGDGSIRVQSSGHSWSEVVIGNDAVVKLSHFTGVSVEERTGETIAHIGAGATIQHALDCLHETSSYTLPTMGGIKRQTIAGATATATHGSGNMSLSGFIREVKLACFDADGNPHIKVIDGGEDLRAVRASLGCMGVVLEVALKVVPKFWLEETMQEHDNIEAILAKERDWPQQQFLVLPYSWRWYAYHRRSVEEPDARTKRHMRRHKWYDYLMVEIGMHASIKAVEWKAKLFGKGVITGFWKYVIPPLMRPHTVTGDSETIFTLHTEHHYTFRHVEMELFIPKSHIAEVAALTQELIAYFAGTKETLSEETAAQLEDIEMRETCEALQGSYVHHYPIFFRRILPEDTSIAMNSGDEERYSMSIFTFVPPRDQGPYNAACDPIARVCARLYSVRPHWGKYNPLSYADLAPLYPELDTFSEICRRYDPDEVFQNDYTRQVLGRESD